MESKQGISAFVWLLKDEGAGRGQPREDLEEEEDMGENMYKAPKVGETV